MARHVRELTAADLARLPDWVAQASADWGPCGFTGPDDAYVLYAPAHLVPGAAAHPTSPVSPDAVLLAELRSPDAAVRKHLVQAVARSLVRREIAAVEAFGDTRAGGVLPAAEELQALGVAVLRPHATTPRLRMELAGTVRWEVDLAALGSRAVKPGLGWRPAATRATRLVRSPSAIRGLHPLPAEVGDRGA